MSRTPSHGSVLKHSNPVDSTSNGLRIEFIKYTDTVIDQQSGCFSGVTNTGTTGENDIAIISGTFSSTPIVLAVPYTDNTPTGGVYSASIVTVSTTSVRVHHNYAQGGAQGANNTTAVSLILIGQR